MVGAPLDNHIAGLGEELTEYRTSTSIAMSVCKIWAMRPSIGVSVYASSTLSCYIISALLVDLNYQLHEPGYASPMGQTRV